MLTIRPWALILLTPLACAREDPLRVSRLYERTPEGTLLVQESGVAVESVEPGRWNGQDLFASVEFPLGDDPRSLRFVRAASRAGIEGVVVARNQSLGPELFAALSKWDGLRSLWITGKHVTTEHLMELAELKEVRSLDLVSCDLAVIEEDWMGESWALERLSIGTCGGFDTSNLAWIREDSLLEASFAQSEVSLFTWGEIIERQRSLQRVEVSRLANEPMEASFLTLEALQGLEHLRVLDIDEPYSPDQLGLSEHFTQLESLEIGIGWFGRDDVIELRALPKLRSVTLHGPRSRGPQGRSVGRILSRAEWETLASLPVLEELHLFDCIVPRHLSEEPIRFEVLQSLTLRECEIQDGHLPLDRVFPQLVDLCLDDNAVTSPASLGLFGLEHLRTLSLNHCELGAGSLRGIGALTELEELHLRGAVRDVEVLQAGDLPAGLEVLRLDNNGLGSRILPALQGLEHLRRLDLSWNALDDEHTEVFATLRGLESVDLSMNLDLTDKGVRHLLQVEALRFADLQATGASSARNRLRRTFPGCRVL